MEMSPRNVLTLILAGGKGTRLEPLTEERAKPAVPFGGVFRIIDFALSNCINSGLRRIFVFSQYKAASLDRHIREAWSFLPSSLGEFVEVLHPQQRVGEHWYRGTADAVYQNIYTIERTNPQYLLILSGDHIYKMDYAQMIRDHIEQGADCTIGCLPVPLHEGRQFGVMEVDKENWVQRFEEKPVQPFPMPGQSDRCLASMGIYVFNAKLLMHELCEDALSDTSSHDFGKDLLPQLIQSHKVRAYPFRDRNTGASAYWRDVGTLDAYFDANLDLVSVDPQLNLYDPSWPIYGHQPQLPPPKFVFADADTVPPRVGHALDSIVCPGSIVSGGEVNRCIVSHNVRVHSYAEVTESLLFEGVDIGRHVRMQRTIVDKFATIPPGMKIGFDPDLDRARHLTVTPSGITVVPKGMRVTDPPTST